jgi:hypothetical protein
VTTADVDDATAAAERSGRLEDQPLRRAERMVAASNYHPHVLDRGVAEHARWEWALVRCSAGALGWVKLPLWGTVERTFAWLGQCWRLNKDRDRSVLSAAAFSKLALRHRYEGGG